MTTAHHIYNPKYYDGVHLWKLLPRECAFKTYKMKDGTLVALFQGRSGANPEIDFVIRMLVPGVDKKPTAPTHTYWVVDLLLKIPQYKREVREIVQYYIDYYDRVLPFPDVNTRNDSILETVGEITDKYAYLEQDYTLSLDFVATVVELFCKNEKLTPGAYWFRNLLLTLRGYIDGEKHCIEVLGAALPGFRR